MSVRPSSAKPDAWIFGALVALLCLAPYLAGTKRPAAWPLFEIGMFALSGIWLALYGAGKTEFPQEFRRAWWPVSLFMAWLAVILLQVIPLPLPLVQYFSPEFVRLAGSSTSGGPSAAIAMSVDPEASWQFARKTLAYFLSFCLVLVLVNRRTRLRTLAYALIGAGLVEATLASFLHLLGVNVEVFYLPYSHAETAVGTFPNRNHLAGYMEMTLAIGIGMMIATLRDGAGRNWRQRLRDWTAWLVSSRFLLRLSLVVMVVALVMTRSRMGNAAFFVSLLVAGLLGLLLSRHATRSTVILLVSLVVVDIFVVGAWFGVDKVMHRIEETKLVRSDRGTEQSMEERVEPGVNALVAMKDYPWLGSGGGTFYVVFPKYREADVEGYYDHAHNDYIQFATETGAVGVGLIGLLVLSTFLVALKTQYERRDPLARGVAFGVAMGILSLMIHSWVDYNLQIPANALTFVVLLAMGWVAWSVERRDDGTSGGTAQPARVAGRRGAR